MRITEKENDIQHSIRSLRQRDVKGFTKMRVYSGAKHEAHLYLRHIECLLSLALAPISPTVNAENGFFVAVLAVVVEYLP